jgi:hypothetical protein
MERPYVRQSGMDRLRDSVQTTIKEQTNISEQKLSQLVAHGEMKRANVLRQESMLLLQHGGRRLEPRNVMRIIRRDNGERHHGRKSKRPWHRGRCLLISGLQ